MGLEELLDSKALRNLAEVLDSVSANRALWYCENTMARALIIMLVLAIGCGGEDVTDDDAGSALSKDSECVASHAVPGGGVAQWWTATECGDGQQCIFGACTCMPRCGAGGVQPIQILRLADRGLTGLRGVRAAGEADGCGAKCD